jgi:hypothetical protein
MGRKVEWPGLFERENGPRPRAGGDGCLEASIVSWPCASPTRITPGMSSRTKGTGNFNRSKVSSQQKWDEWPGQSQYSVDRTDLLLSPG